MKRFLFISSLLLCLLTFTQCKPNSSKDNTLAVKKLMNNENKKKHEIDSLKYWGVDKDKLLKHLKLLVSDKTFLELSVLVKIDLNL